MDCATPPGKRMPFCGLSPQDWQALAGFSPHQSIVHMPVAQDRPELPPPLSVEETGFVVAMHPLDCRHHLSKPRQDRRLADKPERQEVTHCFSASSLEPELVQEL